MHPLVVDIDSKEACASHNAPSNIVGIVQKITQIAISVETGEICTPAGGTVESLARELDLALGSQGILPAAAFFVAQPALGWGQPSGGGICRQAALLGRFN